MTSSAPAADATRPEDVPLVVCPDGTILRNPTEAGAYEARRVTFEQFPWDIATLKRIFIAGPEDVRAFRRLEAELGRIHLRIALQVAEAKPMLRLAGLDVSVARIFPDEPTYESHAERLFAERGVEATSIAAIAAHTDAEPKAVDAMLRGFTDVVCATVAKGDPVVLSGFAKFAKIQTKARMGRNPNEPNTNVEIPSRRVVRFMLDRAGAAGVGLDPGQVLLDVGGVHAQHQAVGREPVDGDVVAHGCRV